MVKYADTLAQYNNFKLKDEFIELIRARRDSSSVFISVTELEASRTRQSAIPASKHSLETICGASCEIGAQ